MKISDFSLSRLRNEEHLQFHTSFKNLVLLTTAAALKIDLLFSTYLTLFANEELALDKVGKSSITDELADADTARDDLFRGLADAVKSARNHFRAEVRAAAKRLQVVLDSYGNIAIKAYEAETGAINKLVIDFNETYAADMATVGLTEWVTELKAKNDAFDSLKNSRYSEEISKTQLLMSQERAKLDVTYREIVERINALIIVEGEANYAPFVDQLNHRIDEYSNMLAIRQGVNNKDNDTPSDTK